jgi:hypothetical protein
MSLKEALENAAKAQELKAQIYEESVPSPGQMSNFGGMLVPGAGILDYEGLYPSLPSRDQPYTEAFSNEPYPSFEENLARGGWGYLDAGLQGLGVAGDAVYASPYFGPPLGLTLKGLGALGAVMRTSSRAGKGAKTETGIATLGKEPMFTPEDTLNLAYTPDGSYSPAIKDLIEKAPPSLKGQGIVQWANKNLKPKELEVLGIDEFIKDNPKATLRETVEGVSGNKVVVGKKILSGEGQVMDFDITTPLEDPLDGSKVYQHEIDNIKYDLENMSPADEYLPSNIKDHYNKEWDVNVESFDDIPKGMVDEVIEDYAKARYMDNPFGLIEPTGVDVGDNTFAFGNEEIGYELFVDGKRITNKDEIAYSPTEAQIQLRDAIADEGYDLFAMDADELDDFRAYDSGATQYKQFIDESLPGGKNYREIIYTFEGAPETHNIGHFSDDIDEGNYLAHALVRDRKLADGTETLHGDELQSDLHRDGAKFGYKGTEEHQKLLDIIKTEQPILEEKVKKLKSKYVEKIPERASDPATQGQIASKIDELFDAFQNAPPSQKVRKMLNIEQFDKNVFSADGRTLSKIYDPKLQEESSLLGDVFYKAEDLVPNYPYKDNYHEMLIKKMLLQAVEEGKPAISISGSAPIKARYVSGNDAIDEKNFRFYENLYDKKIPSYMQKLANKYGGEFQKNSMLDLKDTFVGREQGYGYSNYSDNDIANANANVIKITEEMRNKILLEGIPDFATGGIVNKGIARLRTAKQPTEGIVDLGLY